VNHRFSLLASLLLSFLTRQSFGQVCPLPRSPHDLGIDSSSELPRALHTTFRTSLAQIVGTYQLRVAAEHRADTVLGQMSLRKAPSVMYRFQVPYQGTSDIDLTKVGPVSLGYSPARDDSLWPGVQFRYERTPGRASLVFGGAFSPQGAIMDAGVTFYLSEVDTLGMRGWWENGGRELPHAWGYFCARKL